MSKSVEQSEEAGGPEALAKAMKRLNDALDRLDGAVAKRVKTRDLPMELQAMADDRARLAEDLDAATARGQRLAGVNADVSRRLVKAMETVRSVIDAGPGNGVKG